MAMLEFRRVSKHYRLGGTTVHALDEVDLRIEEGEFVAIVGPSGSGKSTLMHLLGFLDSPTAGTILFDGMEVARIGVNRRATIRGEKIGFVFQSFNLLPRLTVLQNILLPLSYSRTVKMDARKRVWDILDQVGMRDRARHRPNELSGGQRQRVAIARALMNEPRILLADEPTGNLDSQTAKSIIELFTSLNRQGRTVVLVTHDTNIAACSTRQLHVLDGKIVQEVR